jgi:hypothetical protein
MQLLKLLPHITANEFLPLPDGVYMEKCITSSPENINIQLRYDFAREYAENALGYDSSRKD